MVTSTHGQSRQTSLKALLEAGVHFGHQTKRWNPKMKPYIFTERNGIHIIDLQQTVRYLEEAHAFVADLSARGGKVLFVGTKKQAQDIVEREAGRSRQFYINRRWLGGTLTNFVTIRNRLRYMKQLQGQAERGELEFLPKKEGASKRLELERLERTLGGMRDMTQLPGAIFIIDPKREHLAIHEARRLGIPIIGITDTNCDPDDVDFLIPANDDAIRAVRLLAAGIADAAIEGLMRSEISQAERMGDVGRGGGQGQRQGGGRQQAPALSPDFEIDDLPTDVTPDEGRE
ncbi:MAG: SSU ribosomal protein S2p (SAe) [uncultured Thermomicrobiales bacterium]|uniref:Small ribosomal subunit protein uS2 n=1 Tax=uncultured Thermomicrobiales bacterium TaxID=1645740 RepID=A0A6J4TPF1_9BACT|nr:MAG: SSU ribosomal protein S2p (SAe) [uncultured Thermomicrobiales bacterium]